MATLINLRGAFYGIPTEQEKRAPIVFHDGIAGGRVRWRFRKEDLVRLFVRTETGVRHFVPDYENGCWHVREDTEQGENRG